MNREELSVGQVVMFGSLGRGTGESFSVREGTIVKVARAWITVQGARAHDVRKLRIDDQTDGTGYSVCCRWWTLEQWNERNTRAEASKYLREQSIEVGFHGLWKGREIELMELLRAYGSDHE